MRRGTVGEPEPAPPVELTEGKTHTPKPIKTDDDTPEPELPPEIASLNIKARDLVLSAGRKRDEQLAENAKKLTWDLDAYLRSLAKSEQINGVTNVNRIKNLIENNRVPNSILRSDDIEFTRKMEDITNFALRKQKDIDQAFIAEAAKIQSAYIRKLSDAAKAAESAGQKPLHALLKRTLEDTTNLGDWLRSLGVNDTER
jgi:ferritin-like metal-binding protein YciE